MSEASICDGIHVWGLLCILNWILGFRLQWKCWLHCGEKSNFGSVGLCSVTQPQTLAKSEEERGGEEAKIECTTNYNFKIIFKTKNIILHVLSWSLIRYIFWNNAMLPLSYIGLLWMIGFLDALASHDFKLSVKSAINVFRIIKIFKIIKKIK